MAKPVRPLTLKGAAETAGSGVGEGSPQSAFKGGIRDIRAFGGLAVYRDKAAATNMKPDLSSR